MLSPTNGHLYLKILNHLLPVVFTDMDDFKGGNNSGLFALSYLKKKWYHITDNGDQIAYPVLNMQFSEEAISC